MNVFVDGRERDCGYTLLDPRVDLFRAGVARHRLHDLVENLALVSRGEPVIRTKFTERTGLDTGRGPHQELVNDNYSCSSSGGYADGVELAQPAVTVGPAKSAPGGNRMIHLSVKRASRTDEVPVIHLSGLLTYSAMWLRFSMREMVSGC